MPIENAGWRRALNGWLSSPAYGYTVAVAGTAAMVLVRFLIDPWMGPNSPYITFYLAIALAGVFGGFKPGLFATALGAVTGTWLFMYPEATLIGNPVAITRLITYLATGCVIAWVGGRARSGRDAAERAKAEAEEASRAKDHFLAVLSHELRNPLTPIVAAVSLLRRQLHLDEAGQDALTMIERNTQLETQLIDDLLDMTRIARGKIELAKAPIRLCTVVERAIEVCRPDIEARGLHFGVDWGPRPYWVQADPSRLQQVFWNLLRNAIKFTPKEGCVGIRFGREDDHVVAEVNDSGIGIDPEMLPRLFDPFEQAERSITRQFGGLGLGLTISKALVELHGGTIEAHSEGKGQGAVFRVRLPLIAPAVVPEQFPASAPPRVRPLRILLVEDHGDTARIMSRLLAADGHEVQRAGALATALDMAGKGTFDLLISDLGLPDGNGLDLMRQLRARGQRIPGIALSGFGMEQDIQSSHEAGFAAHLTKPTSPERLAEAIAAVVGPEHLSA
ncbi:MAG: ATP-binding protein [Bacillota bacterium]